MNITGRAAGLYLNPNIAATAILLALVLLIQRSSRIISLLASLLALLPILMTFSRGGILCWAILVVGSALSGRMPRVTLPAMILSGTLILLAGPYLLSEVSFWFGIEDQNSFQRLAWLLGQASLAEFASSERQWVAELAWSEFLSSPLVGHGLGYMWVWGDTGTHNLMLRHILEYGVIGLAIFPAFLLGSYSASSRRAERGLNGTILATVFVTSIFSHNLLEQPSFVLPWLAYWLTQSGKSAAKSSRILIQRTAE